MATLLLILIYIAFISLGLPDSIIGVSWPAMRNQFGISLEYGGYISLTVTIGTIISSLLSGYFIKHFKTGKVIVFSILLTSLALFGYSMSDNYIYILLLALPLGFGAGSIDTALNNYVALHYKPHHMNWLHSFWGVGASVGPIIMSFYLLDSNWQKGFLVIAIIQFALMLLMTFSFPLWHKTEKNHLQEIVHESNEHLPIRKIKGVSYALLIFLVYCAIEFSIGIWGSSYMVISKDILISRAAQIVTIYYLGITVGRFASGILSFFLSNRKLIFGGIIFLFIGGLLLLVSNTAIMITISFGILGIGLAPIFPSMIHDTPKNFGIENSQYIIGYQIAFAYIGSAIFPAAFGLLYSKVSINIFPLTIFILSTILLLLIVALMVKVQYNKKGILDT